MRLYIIGRTIRREVLGLKPRQRVPKGMRVFQSLGITMDEGGRARRIKALFAKEHKWATAVFPLLDRFMTRADCLSWLVEYGNVPHDVPRSACVFCPYRPYHSDTEWLRVKADPEDWARAVEIDRALRTTGSVANRDMRQVMYLHDSCRPIEEIEFKPDPRERQMPMSFYRECTGGCGV